MNRILRQILIGLTVLAFTACGGGSNNKKVQENGLTKDINDFLPKDVLDEMISLGMPIHRGGTPPKIEGIYEDKPNILLDSNIPSDSIGKRFDDYRLNFYEQDNTKLTIKVSYKSKHGKGSGHGIGSFIVGTDNKFTIFSKIDGISDGQKYISVDAYSGTITDNGIEDFYNALFMVDDKGDSKNVIISNGQGRVFYDSDGIAEKVDSIDFKFLKNQEDSLLNSKYPDISSSQVSNNYD